MPASYLHGKDPDATGSTVNKHLLTRLETGMVKKGLPGCKRRQRNRSRLDGIYRLWLWRQIGRCYGDIFRSSAVTKE